jgi:prepilin-type N-terminal cleavage/methylation domain-containing protein
MWSARPKHNASAGFSLIEALVALVIAALLAAVLTRFVSNTRMTALKIREQVTMDILGDSLIEHLGAPDLQPGRTDGRIGALRWRLDVSPIPVYARAISVSVKKPSQSETPQSKSTPFSPISNEVSKQPAAAPPKPAINWAVYRLAAAVSAPSGRSHAIETLKILPQQTPEKNVQIDKP